MGKKRIIKKGSSSPDASQRDPKKRARALKRKVSKGVLHIFSSYNNTLITLADDKGEAIYQSSSGALGFRGSKKGTPYAANQAADDVAELASELGVKEIDIRVKGIGAGRESAIRQFVHRGFFIGSIKDMTPTPHGTPRLKKPRRV